MTVKEIIDGLKFTVDMFLFDPMTGETYTEPRSDMDKITIDACKGAIELLEQTRWIPVSERLPERDVNVLAYHRNESFDYQYVSWIDDYSDKWSGFIGNLSDEVLVWMPLPEKYKEDD